MKHDAIAVENNERISDSDRFTLNDLHLAGVYWPILMGVAQDNQQRDIDDFHLIQYAELVRVAKRDHSSDPVVQNAINTSIGRKLDPINWFCRQNALPNLSCLAVNANGEPGNGYMRNNDWRTERAEVAAFDWDSCNIQFTQALKERSERRVAKAMTRRSLMPDQKARDVFYAWWSPVRLQYPDITVDQKERIIALVRQWIPVEEAVAAVLGIE